MRTWGPRHFCAAKATWKGLSYIPKLCYWQSACDVELLTNGLLLEKDDYFMGLALEEAETGGGLGEVPVGAVLVASDGQVLSRAHNMPISSNDPTAHAEVVAIRAACTRLGNYRLNGTVMYVTLEPCAMCVGAMLHARVAQLVFGAGDPRGGSAGSVLDLTSVDRFNHRIEVTGGVMAERCAEVLQRFFRARRGQKQLNSLF